MSGRGPDDWGHLAVKKTLARGQLDYGRVDVGRRRSFGGCSRKALGSSDAGRGRDNFRFALTERLPNAKSQAFPVAHIQVKCLILSGAAREIRTPDPIITKTRSCFLYNTIEYDMIPVCLRFGYSDPITAGVAP